MWVYGTAEELESEIGLAPGALRATERTYNEGAVRGMDPLLYKKPEWLRPIGSAVDAIDLRAPLRRWPQRGQTGLVGRSQRHFAGRRTFLRPPCRAVGGNAVTSKSGWMYVAGVESASNMPTAAHEHRQATHGPIR